MKGSLGNFFKRYTANILLLIFSLCIVLVLVEIFLPFLKIKTIEEAVYQVRRPVIVGLYGQFHPELHYTLKKNLRGVKQVYPGQLDYDVDTNNQGFRGPDWDLSPGRKKCRSSGRFLRFWMGRPVGSDRRQDSRKRIAEEGRSLSGHQPGDARVGH